MFLPLIFIGVFSLFSDIGYDDMLGSTPVGWPEQWAPAMVATDSNHYDDVAELYLYFGVDSKYDLLSGVVEAYLPGDDDSLDCGIDYYGNGDYSDYVITCDVSSSDFTDAGTYGPIYFVVRESVDGQILAQDTAFSYFALIGAKPTVETDGLTIEYHSSDQDLTVQASAELRFSFSLSAEEEIYRGDYFVLTLDSSFDYDTLEFTLNDTTNAIAFENEDDSNVFLNTDDGKVYFIGLSEDLSGNDNANFTFTIKGLSNPSVETTGGSYDWDLKIWRYGTPTLLKWITGDGPSDSVETGDISVESWTPVHTTMKSNMFNGMVTYMTMTLKAKHAIPAGGSVTIVVSGALVCSKTYESDAKQTITAKAGAKKCGITYDSVFSGGTASDSTITLTVGTAAIPASTSFKVTNLIETNSASISISSVTTSKDGNIDTWDSVFSAITLSGNKLVVATSGIYTARKTDTGENEVGTKGTHGFGIYFTAPVGLTASKYTITISAPIKTGATDFDSTNVGYASASDIYGQLATGNDLDITAVADASWVDIKSVTTLSSGSITIADPNKAITLDDEVYIYIGAGSTGTAEIYLPGLITFLKNLPQVVITLTDTNVTPNKVYAYSAPWNIVASSAGVTTTTISPLCKSSFISGLPATLLINPDYALSFSSYSLKVSITSSLDYETFDTVGESLTVSGATSNTGTITAAGFDIEVSSIADAGLTITVPLPVQTADSTWTIDIYVVDSDDNEYLLSTEDVTYTKGTKVDHTEDGDAPTYTAGTPVTSVSFSDSPTGTFVWAIIYTGTRFAIKSPTLTAGDTQVLIATTGSPSATVTSTWFDTATTNVFYYARSGSYGTDSCTTNTKKTYTYAVGTEVSFSTPTWSPTTSNAYTFKRETVDATFTLKLTGTVYPGAVITITMDDTNRWTNVGTWTVTLGTETLTGTTDASTYSFTSIDLTTQSSANPTLTVKITGLNLPEIAKDGAAVKYNGVETVTVAYTIGPTSETWTATADALQTTINGVDNPAFTISKDEAWIFPDLKSSEGVYFGVSFATSIDLEVDDEITISGPTFDSDDDVEDNTWCTLAFGSVEISSGSLVLTLNQALKSGEVITIIKDGAFTPSAAGSIEVSITVSRDGDDIVSDKTSYTVQAATASVESFSVTTSNKIPGFPSVHTFKITLDSALEAGSCLLFDASADYNIALGDVVTFDDTGDEMFLIDEDGSLASVKHWVLEYTTELDYAETESIEFSVEINNPESTGSWKVYVTDVNMTFIASEALAADLTFDSQLDDSIDVYYTIADFTSDFQTHSLEVQAFIDISATADSVFTLMFPAPYNLEFYNSGSVQCSLYLGETEVLSSSCPVSDNSVTFTLSAVQAFTSDSWAIFTVDELVTPKSGFDKNESVYEYDDTSVKTGKFCISYNAKDEDVSVISFDNLNGAYFGFEVVFVNTFKVNGGETISITPGTYSGIFEIVPVNYEDGELSELTGLLTESVTLTAEVKSYYDFEFNIDLSDEGKYTLDSDNEIAYFWIGADSSTPEGMYYIDWSIVETAYDGEETVYSTYLRTKLEVSSELSYEVAVDIPDGSFFYIPSIGTSLPYRVFIDQEERSVSPYETITFTFSAASENVTITFYPEEGLTLDAFETEGYIYASCEGCEDGESYEIIVSQSENSAAFYFDDFEVTQGSAYESAAVATVKTDSLSSSGFRILLDSNSWAIATWCVISEDIYNETLTEYSYLIDNTYNFGSSDTDVYDIEDYINDYLNDIEEVMTEYETLEEISVEIIKLANSVFFIGQSLVSESDGQLIYDFLGYFVFESTYKIVVYVDNYWDPYELPTLTETDATTTAALKPCLLGLTGDNMDGEEIARLLSQILDMDIDQIEFKDTTSRQLSTAKVTLISGVRDQKSAKEKVDDVGTDAIGERLGVSVENLGEIESAESVEWDYGPVWDEIDDGIVSFNFTSAVDGFLYCVAEVNSTYDSSYSSDNIRFGLDRNGDDAYDTLTLEISAYKNKEFNFTADGYGVYDYACVICEDYPLTPTCSEVANYTFDYSDSSSSGAVALVMAVAAYLLI